MVLKYITTSFGYLILAVPVKSVLAISIVSKTYAMDK